MDASCFRRSNFLVYSAVSTAVAAYMVNDALSERPNLYSAGIKMFNGVHLVVVGNWLMVVSIVVAKMLQVALFGELRLIEMEHIYERSWFAITNMLMTIAVYRDHNNLLLGALAGGLLFIKCFHWILDDRLELLFQQQQRQQEQDSFSWRKTLFNRTTFVLYAFLLMDDWIVKSCVDQSFIHSADVFLIFGLDFLMVYLNILDSTLKFILNVVESAYLDRNPEEEVWEPKIWISKVGSVLLSLAKMGSVAFLFVGLMYAHRLPVNFMGDMYTSVLQLVKHTKDLFNLVKAARDLGKNLRDVSEHDLEHDDLCIICRDDMSLDHGYYKSHRRAPKKLNCGHILHYGCLKSWLGRSRVCPTCRSDVFEPASGATTSTGARAAPTPTTTPTTHATPTPTPTTTATSSAGYTLTLPRNAVRPPGWTVLPLRRIGADHEQYEVSVNRNTTARLVVVNRDLGPQ